MYWIIDKKKTKEYWLEANDPEGFYKAIVKWDGCTHFNDYGSVPRQTDPKLKEQFEQYYHICDLRTLIERLQELYEIAKNHFQESYPEEWSS